MQTDRQGRPAADGLLDMYPDFDPAFVPVYAAAVAFTMTSPERMYALWEATRHVLATGVPGAIVECGVWRGGSAIVAADVARSDPERELWLFDTFDGMPEPGEHDVDYLGVAAKPLLERGDDLIVGRAGLDEVRANLRSTAMPEARIHFVRGPVQDTIPATAPERIALLRLDTDWEDSTRHELEQLWPRLSRGGVLIVDDYGHWQGARRAVDEFFASRADAPLLQRIDYTGRIAVRDRI